MFSRCNEDLFAARLACRSVVGRWSVLGHLRHAGEQRGCAVGVEVGVERRQQDLLLLEVEMEDGRQADELVGDVAHELRVRPALLDCGDGVGEAVDERPRSRRGRSACSLSRRPRLSPPRPQARDLYLGGGVGPQGAPAQEGDDVAEAKRCAVAVLSGDVVGGGVKCEEVRQRAAVLGPQGLKRIVARSWRPPG
jgi:hypothetical protein